MTAETQSGLMMMAPSGGSGSSNSTSWTGKASFEEQVLMEPFSETDTDSASVNQPEARPILPANPVASPGSAQEAPAAAPSPAEVVQPAPHPDELERLRNEIHSVIESQVRKECDRRFGPVSRMPEQREANSNTARYIMDRLEIPTETDPTTLQEWRDRIQTDQNLLKSIIREYVW